MFSVFKRMISGWCSVVRIPRGTGAESSEEETISGTPSPPHPPRYTGVYRRVRLRRARSTQTLVIKLTRGSKHTFNGLEPAEREQQGCALYSTQKKTALGLVRTACVEY